MSVQEKIRVLIVDDIAETRENIRRMLQFDNNIEVVGMARTGREAIQLSQQAKPDVIVMDINMPDMDGITATQEIKKKSPFIQVVILSVQSDPSYMRKAMLAGARDFLTKPPMIDELTDAVRRAGVLAQEERREKRAGLPADARPMARSQKAGIGALGKGDCCLQPQGRHRAHHHCHQPGDCPAQRRKQSGPGGWQPCSLATWPFSSTSRAKTPFWTWPPAPMNLTQKSSVK
jgi:pilus assembly protein CpaE